MIPYVSQIIQQSFCLHYLHRLSTETDHASCCSFNLAGESPRSFFGDRSKLGSPRNALWKWKKEQTHNEIRWEASINIQDIHTTPHTKVVLNSSHAFMMHKLECNIFFVAHTAMKWVYLLQPRFRCTTLLLQRILEGWPPANPSPLRPLQRSKMIVCPSRLCVLMCNV